MSWAEGRWWWGWGVIGVVGLGCRVWRLGSVCGAELCIYGPGLGCLGLPEHASQVPPIEP